jgi:hypothetical protein
MRSGYGNLVPTPDRRAYLIAALEYGAFLPLPRDLYSRGPRQLPPVFRLTPGRCSQCGRFVSKSAPPDVWAVDVHPSSAQVPGQPNIWVRTRCRDCISYSGSRRPVSFGLARIRAEMLGQATP